MKYIQSKMLLKKVTLAFFSITFVGLTFQGCADLDPDPQEFNLPPGQFTTLDEFEAGVIGSYSLLYSAARMTTFFAPAWAGDDMTTHVLSNKADFREFDQRNVTNTNGRLLNNWNQIYNTINSLNSNLERGKSLGDFDVDKDRLDRLRGEVYFLRGLLFHHLTRVHSKIPIPITEIPDPEERPASQVEVYERIEADFLKAEELLPVIYPDTNPGAPRPNSGSARAMLARLYLDWAGFPVKDATKFADAATSAKQVMDNATAHGFELEEDLEDLWKVENRFNSESVFTISYCSPCTDLANRKYGITGLPADIGSGWAETFAEVRFFEDFPEGARKEATFRTDLNWQNSTDHKGPIFKKIVGPPGDLPANAFATDRNDFMMRYAEVLLIFAEASGQTGTPSAEAWEALNMVRRRAESLPADTPDPSVDITSGDIVELAITERKWELAGEYLRWYDLVRTETMQEALSQRDPQTTTDAGGNLLRVINPIIGSLGTENYFSPIPQAAIDISPALGE